MKTFKAFKGLRYSDKVLSAEKSENLMAPPYDVISDSYREELYSRSEFNVVKISKSKEISEEPENEQYTKAARLWNEWREKQVTIQDDQESFYFYNQEFNVAGKTFNRLGLVGALKLRKFGDGVLPHEKTLSGPKVDRMRLLSQTKTHFGQIFALYPDDGGIDETLQSAFAASDPIFEFKDDDGVLHSLRRMSDVETVKKIEDLLDQKNMIIADGHHRYETALKYGEENPTLESSCLMVTAVSLSNPGLIILPTHRLLKNLKNFNAEELIEKLEPSFNISHYANKEELLEKMKQCFLENESALGLYSGSQGEKDFTLLVKKKDVEIKITGSNELKNLDVVTLHKLILEDHLGIDEEQLARQSHVEYIKDSGQAIEESISMVDSGSHQAVFLMNATRLNEIESVALNGEKMPQKSTFFFPKIFTGLVTYPVEKGVISE